MRWMMGIGAAGIVAVSLACGGLGVGPGATVASGNLTTGQPTTISYTTPADGDVGVWLTYDLAFTGGSYRVTGPLDIDVNGTSVLSTQLDFGPQGGATAGSNSRVTWGTMESTFNGNGSSSGRIWAHSLEAVPAGSTITVNVAATPASGTTVNALSMELTQ